MSTESISIVWPEACIGCGEKRIRMKDASFKWRSTEPIRSLRKAIGPMISFEVRVHLCEECAIESKELRKAYTSWDLTIWLMKFFFILLIPSILISMYIPGIEYTFIPKIFFLAYPIFATFAVFHDARMINLTRSTPASAFIIINPPNLSYRSLSFAFRSKRYASIFRQKNPTMKIGDSPSVGGYSIYPKRFPKMKAFAIISPSLIALVLIILLAVG